MSEESRESPAEASAGAGTPGLAWDDPRHFPDRAAFRRWLEKNHDTVDELWIGFYRKATGKGGLGYAEAVDECLCWGWIDGVRKKVDAERYTNRLTPRARKSRWSRKNLDRYAELEAEGRVAEPGRRAWRRFGESGWSPEERPEAPNELPAEYRARFLEEPGAWAFHVAQPDHYRKMARLWVTSAKREATRLRRLDKLIRFSAAGEPLPELLGRKTRDEP